MAKIAWCSGGVGDEPRRDRQSGSGQVGLGGVAAAGLGELRAWGTWGEEMGQNIGR